MKLADLVDLEWLLREDSAALGGVADDVLASARPAALRACAERGLDQGAARSRLDVDRALREAVALTVIEAARGRDPDLPGRRVARALEFAAWLLVVLGLLLGAGAARVVLAYDGTTPVNVLHFATVFGALQVVLLVFLVVFLARTQVARASAGPGLLHRPVAWLVHRLLGARGRAAAELLRTLRSRRSLYAGVERWTLFALVQRFGVAFNGAALGVTLALVTGTDLVFSWSTTLRAEAADVHRLATMIATPWSWCWPEAVPSLDAVRASQWVRMPGAFVGDGTLVSVQPLAAEWWRFLVALLVGYGLVPRGAALVFGAWRARRALARSGLDHAACHVMFDRLLPVRVAWSGPEPSSVRGDEPRAATTSPATAHAPAAPGTAIALLAWGSLAPRLDALARLVVKRFAQDPRTTLAVGGASLDADRAALRRIGEVRPPRAVVTFAAGQQPTADALAFLRDLRVALGAARPIVVVLVDQKDGARFGDALAEEHAIWRRSLGTLGDAHLWLETLGVSG
ncbi:MAG: DUF2868 domain-containing protein [Planctomycetes bacterium]|nr:DUF2868 domain-containing protein [Planctomycetota bacterium]